MEAKSHTFCDAKNVPLLEICNEREKRDGSLDAGVPMKKLLQGDALEQRARKLGVDTAGDPITHSASGTRARASDHDLQRRVAEAERGIRESWLWRLALISAIASVISAATAMIAVSSG